MAKLLKMDKRKQIVMAQCPLENCGMTKPHCYDCGYVSRDDIRAVMEKLYKYEKAGVVIED